MTAMEEPVREDSVEIVRSEERLSLDTRAEVSGTVRLSKRIVTEEHTVTMRREVLVVERFPGPSGHELDASRVTEGSSPGSTPPVLELVLSEEQFEVVTRVVPRERVRVYVDAVTESVEVTESLDKEVVDVDEVPTAID
jgi:stress response protein YsnF